MNFRRKLRSEEGLCLDQIERIKKWWHDFGEVEEKDFNWLIEQTEKYQRLRDKMLEQTIQSNYEALKKLSDN